MTLSNKYLLPLPSVSLDRAEMHCRFQLTVSSCSPCISGTLMPYDDAVQSDSCAVEISSDVSIYVRRSRRSIMSLFSLLMCRYSLSRRVTYIQYCYSGKMLPFFITLCRWTLCWRVTYLWWSYCSLMSQSCGYLFMLKLGFQGFNPLCSRLFFQMAVHVADLYTADYRAYPLSISLPSCLFLLQFLLI